MPCNCKEYHPKWRLISKLIRKREKQCCKFCGIRNGFVGKRQKSGAIRELCGTEWDMYYSKLRNGYNAAGALKSLGFTKVVLTVAHLDHDKKNNRFNNLAALCQRCHLKHDAQQHTANRKYGRNHNHAHQFKIFA